jgi:hypothetical protein
MKELITAVNNLIITEIYTSQKKIKTVVNSGFASISQKGNLVSLTVLADAIVSKDGDSITINKGSKVLIKEELLHNQKTLVQRFQINEIGDYFMIVPFEYIVGIIEKVD